MILPSRCLQSIGTEEGKIIWKKSFCNPFPNLDVSKGAGQNSSDLPMEQFF
jgi:hypothetical protein